MEGTGKSGGQSNGGATSSAGTDRRKPLSLRLIVISSPVPRDARGSPGRLFAPVDGDPALRWKGSAPPETTMTTGNDDATRPPCYLRSLSEIC